MQETMTVPITHPTRSTRPSPLAAVLTVGIVVMVQAGGLVSGPLDKAGLIWGVYGALLVLAVIVSLPAAPWRRPVIALLLLFWVVLWCWMPQAMAVAPDAGAANREREQFAQASILCMAATLAGLRAGLHWWRIGWFVGLLLVGGIGVWELITGNHLWVSARRPWPFPDDVAAATYINPNNFGIALLAMLVAVLAWRAGARSAVVRAVTLVAALFAAILVLLSQSRAAALGLFIVLCLEALRVLRSRPGMVREAVSRHRRSLATVSVLAITAAACSFLVPSLAARNPIAHMLYAAIQSETMTSDLLRVRLVRVALRYALESGFLGTGAGSFEPMLWNDPTSGIEGRVNLHNAFVELFVQYGVVVTLPLLALIGLIAWILMRSRWNASIRPWIAIPRTEALGMATVYVALGFTASSALTLPVWWLMAAHTCISSTVVLGARTRRDDSMAVLRDS